MKSFLIFAFLTLLTVGCKSVREKIKQDKRKFIQVAQENSKPIEFSDVPDLLEEAKENNTEKKIKHLGVDKMEVIYGSTSSSRTMPDSVVVFKKSDYLIVYDFATMERDPKFVQQQSGLKDFEKIDDRLYIGKN